MFSAQTYIGAPARFLDGGGTEASRYYGVGAASAGTKLGRYQIVKHLASGGMAEVLLARATGIEGFARHVVIKRIRPAQAKDPAFVQMFLNEARLAAQLHHHNIVQVHDIGQEGNEYFFAMEYVHGEDLRRLLTQLARHKQKLPIEHAVTIISATAIALHHAHEQRGSDRKPLGIVHRDVTPANILVGYDGNVKVVDFGIAKAASKTTEATVAGALKGKASYMAPEQCTGKTEVDRRSDVFALGITAHELVTTRRLFKADSDFLSMSAIVAGNTPSPRQHRPDLPEGLEAIIMKALANKPEDRYQTADQMREALEAFASKAGLRTSTSALGAYMKQQFGERPEPWLIEEDEELELSVDFDGSASGIAHPPQEAVNQLAIPKSIEAMQSSPIMKARTKAITGSPSTLAQTAAVAGKKPLPAVTPAAQPVKRPTAQIPIGAVQASIDKSKRRDMTPVPATAAARRKPITVQIPVASQTAGAGAQPKASGGVPLPGMAIHQDSEATVVSAIPKDVDASWDASRPMAAPAAADLIAAEQTVAPTATNATKLPGVAETKAASSASAEAAVAAMARKPSSAVTPAYGTKPMTASVTPEAKPVAISATASAIEPAKTGKPAGVAEGAGRLASSAKPAAANANDSTSDAPKSDKPATESRPNGKPGNGAAIDQPLAAVNGTGKPASKLPGMSPVAASAPAGAALATQDDSEEPALLSAGLAAMTAGQPVERQSAPSLPPPPANEASAALAAVGTVDTTSATVHAVGTSAAVDAPERAAASEAPKRAAASEAAASVPDIRWSGGSSATIKASPLKALLSTPRRIAVAAGGLVALIVVIVLATGGGDDKKRAAPAVTPAANKTPPVPEPIAAPPEPTPEPVAAPEPAPEPIPAKRAPKPPTKKPVKATPKRVAQQPKTTKTTKPAAKPAPKTTKPAVKKTPVKKWDPNALFPKKK